jgi:hypothetical protein
MVVSLIVAKSKNGSRASTRQNLKWLLLSFEISQIAALVRADANPNIRPVSFAARELCEARMHSFAGSGASEKVPNVRTI